MRRGSESQVTVDKSLVTVDKSLVTVDKSLVTVDIKKEQVLRLALSERQ